MKATIRRGALVIAVSAFSMSLAAPGASASVGVCNQATPHWLGDGLVALDPPVNSPAARYTVDIGKLPAKGAGVFQAAAKSPSLTLCDDVVVGDDGSTVDIGDGISAG
jgi:hypothetical protein